MTLSLVWASYSSIFLFISSISAWQKEKQFYWSAFVLAKSFCFTELISIAWIYLHRLHFLSDCVHDESKLGLNKIIFFDWNMIMLKHVKCKTYSSPVSSAPINCDLGPSQQKLAWDSETLWPVSLCQPQEAGTSDDTGDHPRPQGQLRGGCLSTCWPPLCPMPPSFSYCPVSILRKECDYNDISGWEFMEIIWKFYLWLGILSQSDE